jgi:hypothetical protein
MDLSRGLGDVYKRQGSYPASRTARLKRACCSWGLAAVTSDVFQVTLADSVAKLTLTSLTSVNFPMARSTRATHEAQVIPPIPISQDNSDISQGYIVLGVLSDESHISS